MPPQIKNDLNRSGWETTDFPSVCEHCLPENPYVKILKEDHGAECKLCTRPFTNFTWKADRSNGRKKRTNICLTCARLKNCCQSCMLDISYGLPIAIRDAALKMVAPGPQSDVNREYFAQNNEKLIENGKAGTEAYEKTDDKARELLRRLARSKPYFRKGRSLDQPEFSVTRDSGGSNTKVGAGARNSDANDAKTTRAATGPAHDSRCKITKRRKGAIPSVAQLPPSPRDWLPPDDRNVMSLFVTGIEDDLPEYKIRDFFASHGKIKSLVCSHMSHCAFINYERRDAAERAAEACRGRAVIAGCPLRIRWGQPKAIGLMDREERGQMLRDGRLSRTDPSQKGIMEASLTSAVSQDQESPSNLATAYPPGGESSSSHPDLAGG